MIWPSLCVPNGPPSAGPVGSGAREASWIWFAEDRHVRKSDVVCGIGRPRDDSRAAPRPAWLTQLSRRRDLEKNNTQHTIPLNPQKDFLGSEMPGLVSRTMLSRLGPGLSGPFPPALNEGGFCDRPTGQAPHWAEANRKAHPATIVLGAGGDRKHCPLKHYVSKEKNSGSRKDAPRVSSSVMCCPLPCGPRGRRPRTRKYAGGRRVTSSA